MDIDPQDAERVVEAVERISYVVEHIGRRIEAIAGDVKETEKTVDEATKKAEKGTEKVRKGVYGIKYEVDRIYRDAAERDLPRIMFGGQKLDRALEEANARFKRWQNELARQFEARGAFFGGTEKALGIKSALGGARNLIGQLTSGMPFGGLLGFMLWGGLKDEMFRASAARAVYHIRALGGEGQKQLGLVQTQMRAFYSEFGDEGMQMVDAAIKGFTEFGVTGAQQIQSAGVAVKGFGSSIRDVSIALDALTESPWGTVSKLIGQTMESTGASIKEASDDVLEMTARIRSLHLSYGTYSAGLTQATSALRLHNQSLGDTTTLFERLYSKLRGRGIGEQKAGQMALDRITAGAGAVSGLPEGLQALLAQGFASRGQFGYGGMTDPFALLTRFRLGEEGPGTQGFMSATFADLKKRAYDMAGPEGDSETRRLRAIGALSRVGNMSEQAAAAIVDSSGDTSKILGLMKPAAEATRDLLADLNKAFGAYSDRQDGFEQFMRKMQTELAAIGSALLSVASGLFTQVTNFFRILPLMLKDIIPGAGELTEVEKDAMGKYTAAQAESASRMFDAWENIGPHLKKIDEAAGTTFDTLAKPGERQKAFLESLNKKQKSEEDEINAAEWYYDPKTDRMRRKVKPKAEPQPEPKRVESAVPAGTLSYNQLRDAGVRLINAVDAIIREEKGGRRALGSESVIS